MPILRTRIVPSILPQRGAENKITRISPTTKFVECLTTARFSHTFISETAGLLEGRCLFKAICCVYRRFVWCN